MDRPPHEKKRSRAVGESIDLFGWNRTVSDDVREKARTFMQNLLEGDNMEHQFKKARIADPTRPEAEGAPSRPILKPGSKPMSKEDLYRVAPDRIDHEERMSRMPAPPGTLAANKVAPSGEYVEASRKLVPMELCYTPEEMIEDGLDYEDCFIFELGRAYVVALASPWFSAVCQREMELLDRITWNSFSNEVDHRMYYILDEVIYSRFDELPSEVRPYLYPKLVLYSFIDICMGGYIGVREYVNCCSSVYQFAVEVAYLIALNFDPAVRAYVSMQGIYDVDFDTESDAAKNTPAPETPYDDEEMTKAIAERRQREEHARYKKRRAEVLEKIRRRQEADQRMENELAMRAEARRRREDPDYVPPSLPPGMKIDLSASRRALALWRSTDLSSWRIEEGLAVEHLSIVPETEILPPSTIVKGELTVDHSFPTAGARDLYFVKTNRDFCDFVTAATTELSSCVPEYIQSDPDEMAVRLRRLALATPFMIKENMIGFADIMRHYACLQTYSSDFTTTDPKGLTEILRYCTDTHLSMLAHLVRGAVSKAKKEDDIYTPPQPGLADADGWYTSRPSLPMQPPM